MDADRGERRDVGERDADASGAVGAGHALGGGPAEREVLGLAHMRGAGPRAVGEDGLEEARVGVVHGARGGERAEVGGALRPRLPPSAARDEAEDERAEDDRDEPADEHDRCLAALPHAGQPQTAPAGEGGRAGAGVASAGRGR